MSDTLMMRLNADLRSKSVSYYTIAEKTVQNGKKTGVFAALERFFYKLDFLLKYGHLPSEKDVWRGSLPPELQGLKDFLTATSKKNGGSYILQRNEKERYRFSRSNDKLFVSKEEFSPVSPAGARTGYTCTGGWHVSMLPQECKVKTLLHMITQSNAWLAKEFKNTFGSPTYNSNTEMYSLLPPTSNNHPPLTPKKGGGDNFIKDYQKRITEIAGKAPNYFVSWEGDVLSAFTSCVADLERSIGNTLSFSGIKIPHDLHAAIIKRILPGYEEQQKRITVLNTEPFSTNEVNNFISLVTGSRENIQLELIRNTLQHPQFPLAFLAVVSQGICGGDANAPVLTHFGSLVDYFMDMGVETSSLLIHEYSITPLDEGEGLLCESIVYQPCRIDDNIEKIGIGVSRACNTFCIPEDFIGKKEHNEADVKNQLAPLTSTIITAITI